MLFLKTPKEFAESTKQKIKEFIDINYSFESEGNFVLIPVVKKIDGYDIVEKEAQKREINPRKMKDVLSSILSEDELEKLTTSFDIIGEIAIVEISDELIPKEKEIGQAILKVHKNVRSVYKKLSAMKGEFRLRELGLIAGLDDPITEYKESDVKMVFDISKVYFSVRLSHERLRIAQNVKDHENILVMFAGVGPFALVIAKKKPNTKITAIEKNPIAIDFMKKNIEINHFKNITPILGDVKTHKFEKYDRIIMPLPHTAHEFLKYADQAAKIGTIIHFYSIVPNDEPIENAMSFVENYELQFSRIVRPYSKDHVQVVLDLIKTG